jgi:hypothetical protein
LKLDPTEWLALATVVTATVALLGVIISLRSQRKRERERWMADRRLEAYSRLAFTASEIGAATATRGQVFHEPKAETYMLQDSQAKWEQAHQAFNEAQHLSSLLAGKEVATLIVRISGCVADFIQASERASRQSDIRTGSLSEGDPAALKDMEEAQKQLAGLRMDLVNATRRELFVPMFTLKEGLRRIALVLATVLSGYFVLVGAVGIDASHWQRSVLLMALESVGSFVVVLGAHRGLYWLVIWIVAGFGKE